MKKELVKFLPSYVGSKAYWIDKLLPYKGQEFVEVFCGSAVISANLAKTAYLNDLDPIIYKVLSNFDQQIVPKTFSKEDYFEARIKPDWWKHLYCLQKMSFSGVFRYSKNGYNVPIKKNLISISVAHEYKKALKKYKQLNPTITNVSYNQIPLDVFKDKVVVFDPPYEGSQAAYNKEFDYDEYWKFVRDVAKIAKTVLIFDTENNLKKQSLTIEATRKMRVNGKKQGSLEAMVILGENLLKK